MGKISNAPGAFPYEAKFTYDLSKVNSLVLPNLVGSTGLMNATITALGHTYSVSDPAGSLTLSSATGDNIYGQKVSDGTASLDVSAVPVSAIPASASDNPIKTPALAQSFSFAGTPFSFSSTSGSLTRTIFTEGSTNILANINTVTYSAGTSFADIVKGSVDISLGGSLLSTTLQPTNIEASFTPNFGLTLAQAAAAGGYSEFDWQQTIKELPDNVVEVCVNPECSITTDYSEASVPFNDPPPNGYPRCNPNSAFYKQLPDCSNRYPFYYDASNLSNECAEFDQDKNCIKRVLGTNSLLGPSPIDQLNFFDFPANPKLVDDDAVRFETRLVGVLPTFVPGTGKDCLRRPLANNSPPSGLGREVRYNCGRDIAGQGNVCADCSAY